MTGREPRLYLAAALLGALALLLTGADGGQGDGADGGAAMQMAADVAPPADAPPPADKASDGPPATDPVPTAQDAQPSKFEAMRAAAGDQPFGSRLVGILGVMTTLGLAFSMSIDRGSIRWPLVAMGTGLQIVFAILVLKTAVGEAMFRIATDAVNKLLSFNIEGSRFVFGNIVDNAIPVTSAGSPTELVANTGSMIAFGVLPSILFFSALTSLLYYLGILQVVVRGMAWVMRRTMGTSGAESLSAAANIFVGQTEAPLLVKPYLNKMTKSELMAVMTGGFATVAGGVMAAYVGMLSGAFPDIAGHLLAASVMSAPASLVMSKIIVPETEVPETMDGAQDDPIDDTGRPANALDAIAKGTSDGLMLALNVGAMLISFIALIALVNWMIGAVGGLFGYEGVTLQVLLGYVLAPLAWLLGVPWVDAPTVGGMMGTKTVVNEFVAYLDLNAAMQGGGLVHPKSVVIATYALCGFSNFGSIGIQIGGLATIAPERRQDLARIGLRSMIGASLACFQTAALAGMLI